MNLSNVNAANLKENDMFFGNSEIIKCLYGMKTDTADVYAEKRKAAIELLGDKYLLAKPVERKHG